jgi:hypothetical protein
MKTDVYQRITDQIVCELEKGVRPWMKPWNAEHAVGRITRPLRGNGIPYKGINVLMLWSAAIERGCAAPVWMTFKQASESKANVRKPSRTIPLSQASLPSAHREVIDVLRTGPKEIEEVDVLTLTGLADTQQNKGVAKAFLRGKPVYHAAKQRECLHGVLRIIVVPWDIVEIQKSEHLIAIFLQAIDELACSLTGIIVDDTFIESINRIPKLAQEAFLEAASVHRFNYRLHHAGEIRSKLL